MDNLNSIIKNLNDTERYFPSDKCIHTLFEEQVLKTPRNIAVECGDRSITYSELNSKANEVANYLRKSGVRNEILVGLCIERSIEMVISLFAILKSGGAYVPIDPNYPQERISYLIEDSKVNMIISRKKFSNKINDDNIKIIFSDNDFEDIRNESDDNLQNNGTSENLAYIIYTSGSTGKPKGVMGIHRASVNRFYWMWEKYPFNETEICCQKTSLSFVDSIWEIFGPILKGIKLIIISDEELRDNERFIKTLFLKKISRIVLVPSLLRIIIETCKENGEQLKNLKYWFSSGEQLTFDLYKKFNDTFYGSKLINLYGSSEVAADVTVFDTDETGNLKFIPLGKPISNCKIYILDEHLKPVNCGEVGELHIAGECLARGYLYKPELTKEKFIPSPFTDGSNKYLYKTGDIVKYDDAGNIEYKGRTDHQVKIRGLRIELGEIENSIKEFPGVIEAIVQMKEGIEHSGYLSAYATMSNVSDEIKLKNFLRKKLPEYMIPAEIYFLKEMPLTPNGKIDRNALLKIQPEKNTGEKISVLPKTPTEEAVLEIWEEVFGKKGISVNENFLEIGGHSLFATKIISRIRKTFDIGFPLKTIFEKPTITELADEIQKIIYNEIYEMTEEEAQLLLSQNE